LIFQQNLFWGKIWQKINFAKKSKPRELLSYWIFITPAQKPWPSATIQTAETNQRTCHHTTSPSDTGNHQPTRAKLFMNVLQNDMQPMLLSTKAVLNDAIN
jgi:hypothetical protein